MALTKINYNDKDNYQSSALANEYKVTASDMNEIKTVVNSIIDALYPVGSIYISVNNTNPSTIYGGTWTAFGTGRTLVGIDTGDTDFDTSEKTGGSKALQQHNHNLNDNNLGAYYSGVGYVATTGTIQMGRALDNPELKTTSNAGTGNSGNLQPYICVYMWKRVS